MILKTHYLLLSLKFMENKPTHGGAREGSGAPKKEVLRKAFCIKLPPELIEAIPKPRTKFIELAVIAELELRK